jgi:hypothetical protein
MSEGSTGETSEQATEDVSGVVMQAGQPLAGVAVTVEGSGVTAITGPDGSYTLKALPAGKLSTLVLKQNGKQLASGKIDLLRGRAAVADFDVKSSMAPAASALRIIPSTVVLKRNPKTGATGTLKGTARDQTGKPVTRGLLRIFGIGPGTKDQALPYLPIALTKNESLAAARTDSQGRYTFLNVPAGDYLVTVQKSGLQPISTRVTVKPNVATEAQSRLTAVPRGPATDRQRTIVRGTSTAPAPAAGGVNPIVISRDRALGSVTSTSQPSVGALRGQVVDGLTRKPIAGATVLIAGRRVQTDQTGNFTLADLAPGNYLAKVTSTGFSDDQQSITIRAGATSREEFALKRLEDSKRTARVVPETPRVATAIRLGQVRGRVVDAANGAPIVGAVVAVSGGHSVVTGRDGSYNVSALPPGSYQVSINRTGFAEKRTTFTIRAGEVTDASFRLTTIVRKPTR